MRVQRSLLALASAAALAAAAAATDVQQQQQRSLFQRAAQVIQGAFLGGQQTTAGAAATAEGEQLPKLEDPWETQPGLKMVRRLLDGDQLGVVLDMARNPELEQIWGTPLPRSGRCRFIPCWAGSAG